MATFKKEYSDITEISNEVVEEYFNVTNENYISAKITPKELINEKNIIKAGIAFALGAFLAFVLCVMHISAKDRRKVKKKKLLIDAIKKNN